MVREIQARDIVTSIADALQYVSYYHPADFVQALKAAHQKESSAPARNALLQLLVNSKLSAQAQRPVCQDTGVAHVFFKLGMTSALLRLSAPARRVCKHWRMRASLKPICSPRIRCALR